MIRMKNSGVEWIGEIPEDWDVTHSKNIFTQRSSRGNDVEEQLAATQQHGMYPQKLLEGVVQVKEGTDLQQFKTVHKNDYVISLRSFQGGFEMSDYEGVCSPAYQVFYNTIPISYRYYKYLFKSDGFISKMNSLTVGIREGKNIQYKDFSNSPIIIPPKSTQQRIASYLDKKCSKIEETIQNQQQVIEKLKAYKQSLITEAVTGKIKIQNGKVCGKYENYKDSGVEWIGKIPSEWISTRVGHLYKSILGKMVCPNQLTEEHTLQKYLCAMNVHFDGVDLSEIKEMWFTPNEMNQYQVRNGDLLVVEGGAGAGGASIVYGLSENDKIFIQNSIHLVKPVKTNYLPKYLYYWIYSLVKQNYIDYTCNKATIPHFTKEKLEGMPIAISDKITQQEIIVYLDKKCTVIDTAIEQKQNLIEKLTEYKKSLIYECVTRKKEI